jgi:hypothetical protein
MPLACSTAPRLARPLHIVRIRPASKLAGTNFDNMQGVLNNYSFSFSSAARSFISRLTL